MLAIKQLSEVAGNWNMRSNWNIDSQHEVIRRLEDQLALSCCVAPVPYSAIFLLILAVGKFFVFLWGWFSWQWPLVVLSVDALLCSWSVKAEMSTAFSNRLSRPQWPRDTSNPPVFTATRIQLVISSPPTTGKNSSPDPSLDLNSNPKSITDSMTWLQSLSNSSKSFSHVCHKHNPETIRLYSAWPSNLILYHILLLPQV